MNRQAMLALLILGGAIGIAALLIALRPEPEEAERIVQAPLVQAIAFEPASGPLMVMGSGTVQPREEVSVGAQVGGKLTYVNPGFREGSIVGGGTTLFRIDPSDYRNLVRSAQADVAAQDVAVLQAREEVRIAREELRRFAERENAASGDLMAQSVDANDYASRILPPREVSGGSARESLADARRSTPSTGRLATRQPQLRSAQAARSRASANLADAQLALSRTRVTAPFGGIVRSESAAVGTLVQPGQVLGSIVSTSAFEVKVSLTEDEAALIPGLLGSGSPRTPANVYFDYGGQTYRWSAFVDRADAILDAETRTIDVFLRVPSPMRGGELVQPEDAPQELQSGAAPPLLLGSFVRAEMTGGSVGQFAAIPSNLVRPGNQIWVVREGKLRILPVRIIQRTDDTAYITTPTLAQGGRLVSSSLRAPVDGMSVRVEGAARARAPAERKSPVSE